MQQYLPFTVLKQETTRHLCFGISVSVATVLTVYGIETVSKLYETTIQSRIMLQQYLPFTVLKLKIQIYQIAMMLTPVATVLTVYGIETSSNKYTGRRS